MRRRVTLPLLVVALSAGLLAPVDAAAQTTFTFYGSGYGHGIGLSQWGAFGLARAGWTAEEIVAHYYTDTTVTAFDLGAPLRVGLGTGRSSIRIQATGGDVPLTLADAPVATIPAGETWTVLPSGAAGFEIRDAAGTTVAGPIGDAATPLAVPLAGTRAKILETGRTYARGTLELGLHLCGKTCSIRLVLVAAIEEYLYGVAEVPGSWPVEALEAQAITARTYAANKAMTSQHRSPCDCAILSTTYDQLYVGYDKEIATGGSRWMAAVDATAGQVVTYGGLPIQAYFMSSSGGYTESNEAVWGGAPIPYLRGVCDPGDYVAGNPSATWTVTRSAEEVTAALKLSVGTVTGFTVDSRGQSGRILRITVIGDGGSTTISGNSFQARLGLKDDRLWIGTNLLVTGGVRTKYDALRCAPGAALTPQATVRDGLRQRFAAATIFQGPDLGAFALSGAVLRFYLEQKGPRGALGFPTTDVRTLASGATRARFQGGVVTCVADGSSCRIGTPA